MNDHIHSSEQDAHPQNVDAYILPESDGDRLSSQVDNLFGDVSSFDMSTRNPGVEELQLYNVNSLRERQMSRQRQEIPHGQPDPIQGNVPQQVGNPPPEAYSPMPASALHSVFEEETIEFNASSVEQTRVLLAQENGEENKRNPLPSFDSEEYSKTSLIDTTLHNLVCSEPFLSEDDLLYLLKKDEFIGRHISRKALKKALRRNDLSTPYQRFRMYMAG